MKDMQILAGEFVILATAVFILVFGIERERQDEALRTTPDRRAKSITFIMGEDKTDQPYFANAALHYATNESEGTDYVVQSCRTIEDIIRYLNNSSENGPNPWSVINVVAHGNPQTGLNLNITENGHKATPKRLVQAALRGDTPIIDNRVVDSTTKINFWSCGIGKSPLINFALSRIFRPQGTLAANVYCSPQFVIFHKPPDKAMPLRLKASYWPYYYKRGYRPGNIEIGRALQEQYPDAGLDWASALRRQGKTDSTQTYYGEYHIPVSFTRIYDSKEVRPEFNNDDEKLAWAMAQPEIRAQLEEAGIPAEKFHWTINKILLWDSDGQNTPAVKAIGMSTVLYVLQEEQVQGL